MSQSLLSGKSQAHSLGRLEIFDKLGIGIREQDFIQVRNGLGVLAR